MEVAVDVLLLASVLLGPKYNLPETRRAVLSLCAAVALIVIGVAGLHVMA